MADTSHTILVTINDCQIQNNTRGGIYGKGVPSADKQLNAIRITNNHINQNHGFGINIMGTNIVIRDNIIEGNDSTGLMLGAREMGAVTCNVTNMVVEDNYFEANKGGSIYIESYYDAAPATATAFGNLVIDKNYFNTPIGVILKPGVVAEITLAEAAGGDSNPLWRGVKIGSQNSFSGTVTYYVDGRDVLSHFVTIGLSNSTSAPLTYYHDITGANIYSLIAGVPTFNASKFILAKDTTSASSGDHASLHRMQDVEADLADYVELSDLAVMLADSTGSGAHSYLSGKDAVTALALKVNYADVKTFFVFAVGGGNASDTTAITDSLRLGSFYNGGARSIVIDTLNAVMLHGEGIDTLAFNIYWSKDFRDGAVGHVSNTQFNCGRTTGTTYTNLTTGNIFITFDHAVIPPGQRVWMSLPYHPADALKRKPRYFEVSLIGHYQ
jgi:hypothetical protein